MFAFPGNNEPRLFDEFRRLQQELEQAVGASPWRGGIRSLARGSYPPVNIGVTSAQVDLYLFAAGVDPGSLDISIQQNLLTVAGVRRISPQKDANYYRKERYDGEFRRVVTLPDDVDPERVSARYRDGVLHVCIQRRESSRPRKIEIS